MSKNNKNLSIMEIKLNEHNKQEYPPMHTVEHILNRTMVRLFNCGRAVSAHIEKKKSKCDYLIDQAPTSEQMREIENRVNEVILQNLPVTIEYVSQEEAAEIFDLNRLPENVSQTLRIVKIGDYDACPCIGSHVNNTSEIGIFSIISSDFADGKLRIRFKLI